MICTSCGNGRLEHEFYKRNGKLRQPCAQCICKSSNKWKKENKERCKQKRKEWYIKNKVREIEESTNWSLMNNYGITLLQYNELREEQDFRCKVCGIEEKYLSKRLHVDHNHDTGKVRGLLCHNCNTAIVRTVEKYHYLIPKALKYLEDSND